MSQSNETENIYESIKPVKSLNKRCINDKCIQTIAWMLLTIVLCIIGFIIYMASHSDVDKEIETNIIEDRNLNGITDHRQFLRKFGKRPRPINENCSAFAVPYYEMSLTLYGNRTVKAVIENSTIYHNLNIIWFYEISSSSTSSSLDEEKENDTIDYNCTPYKSPYLFIEIPLKENQTYTFCITYRNKQTTSPCNCQPLYVPPKRQIIEFSDAMEMKDDRIKIGFLCLILTISAFAGAGLGFLSIKTYPELLEGSKNVLVIHKSREIIGNKDSQYLDYKPSYKKDGHLWNSEKIKKRLSLTTSSTKLKLDSSSWKFYSKSVELESDYELPRQFNDDSINGSHRSIPNTYSERPISPPPSPKKKTNVNQKDLGVVNEAYE